MNKVVIQSSQYVRTHRAYYVAIYEIRLQISNRLVYRLPSAPLLIWLHGLLFCFYYYYLLFFIAFGTKDHLAKTWSYNQNS